MNVLVLALTFLAINLDFFIMMLFLLKKYSFRAVLFGFMAATMLLMVLCFIAGQLLENFLPEWLLGVLGIIPIYVGLKGEDEEEGDVQAKSPFWIVFGTYLSVCTGCNLSIFLPVLLGKSWTTFAVSLVVIAILTLLVVSLINWVDQKKLVTEVIDRFGEQLMRICYILIGLYVFYDSGLIAHLYELIVGHL
ncbi:cadmium resistance transporter [Fructobacillus durionis]|uniref:Cadmium resistance protein CadD, predicted permease n=1 Tax=Fructobacillus durionis TaxID=283737 RepID=A0A1I1GST7_9LACO|nr:cadmium resistance transporter [Fructobacillus durionis]SFC14566.1 Cadmium resistance protein CadD, predicted permease [Fructobacillus durionis]